MDYVCGFFFIIWICLHVKSFLNNEEKPFDR